MKISLDFALALISFDNVKIVSNFPIKFSLNYFE